MRRCVYNGCAGRASVTGLEKAVVDETRDTVMKLEILLCSVSEWIAQHSQPYDDQIQHLQRHRSSSVLLYVHRDYKDYYGRGAQDVHFDFHIAPQL